MNRYHSNARPFGLLLLALAMICLAGLSGCSPANRQAREQAPAPLAPWEVSVLNSLPPDGVRDRYLLPEQRILLEQGRYRTTGGEISSVFASSEESGRYRLKTEDRKQDKFNQQDRIIRLQVPEYIKK